jgi:asparagine synthase (glutamine-hydrolysing)
LNRDRFFQASQLLRFSSTLPGFYVNNLFSNKTKRLITKYDNDFRGFSNEIDVMLALDYQMSLQNDVLTKVDRATMSVSLEGREPLLDHRLIEFVAQLPIDYKIEGNSGKRILKDIVYDYIPKELMDRPKAGFSLPIYSWLLSDLRYFLDEYLSEKAIAESGLFNISSVSYIVRLFRNNKLYYKSYIWKLLMFQMWYARWMKG